MTDNQRNRTTVSSADATTAASGSGGSGGGYDVFNDEIKVYKYEGEQEPPASETLSEDKRVLVTDVEENIKQSEEDSPEDKRQLNGILENPFSRGFSSFSSFIPPYPYPGCSAPFGLGAVPHPGFPFYNDFFAQPPPAHMGFPSWSLATAPGFCSPTPMYGLPGQAPPFYGLSATHQGPPTIYPPIPPSTFYPTGFSPVPAWPHGSGYPFSCFPQLSKFQSSSVLGSHLGFSYPGISHPALVSNLSQSNDAESPLAFRPSGGNSSSKKPDSSKSTANNNNNNSNNNNSSNNNGIKNSIHSGLHPFTFNPQLRHHPHHHHHHHHHPDVLHLQSQHTQGSLPQRSEFATSPRGSSRSPLLTSSSSSSSSTNKVPHIKKPLNAFMLFMKEMRQKVIDECTLKESSAINQILGRKWHSLDRTEQTKYYDMARREKELHRQLYPSWTARDNYAIHARKRRRKEMMRDDEKGGDGEDRNAIDCMNAKKCRARYGVEQQYKWCKPCRRKKRCIRFMHDNNSDPFEENEDENSSASSRLPLPRGGSNSNNNNNNSSNNPSAADSTTEIFSPVPTAANADDSRSRCKIAHPAMEEGVQQIHPGGQPPLKRAYPSPPDHAQLGLNGLRSAEFSTSSTSASSQTITGGLSARHNAPNQTEYIPRNSVPEGLSGREAAPFFASSSGQNVGRCSHYCQPPVAIHSGQSQTSPPVSFSEVPSPDVGGFSVDEGIGGKVKIQEGRLQQAATIF